MITDQDSYWKKIWKQFRQHRLGLLGLYLVGIFCLIGIYAPFLASSKPLFVLYDNQAYFPLFRYLFYTGFYTKRLDIFFNLLIFTLPLLLLIILFLKDKVRYITSMAVIFFQLIAFSYFAFRTPVDPAANPTLNQERHLALQKLRNESQFPTWDFELHYMTPYAKLNTLLRYQQRKAQDKRLQKYAPLFADAAKRKWLHDALREKRRTLSQQGMPISEQPSDETLNAMILTQIPEKAWSEFSFALPSLWKEEQRNEMHEIARYKQILTQATTGTKDSEAYRSARAELFYLIEKRQWLEEQSALLRYEVMPLLSHFHWEDDAGGQQRLNQYLHWWELTRINHKDLLAALIFGVRISLVVGITAVALALLIGVPIGALAGFYGGRLDIIVSRLLEVWESMPTFFMLLMVVAILQSKSIFLVIGVIGLFGWTHFSRYIRGEFFKQRNLPYVEACKAQGFTNRYLMFKHILPNAIPPVLTLLPFAIMGAITSEAALSFLGLGEEGSCSWGVLMDEGRTAFPQESYLLWPPAIALTILLIAIAVVGDSLRDALDPKSHR